MIKVVTLSLGIITIILMIVVAVLFSGVGTTLLSNKNYDYHYHLPAKAIQIDSTMDLPQIAGENLFKNNCSSCLSIHEVVVGPALFNITARQSKIQIRKWIRDSQKLIYKDKDKYAVGLFEEYNRTVMTSFPSFFQ